MSDSIKEYDSKGKEIYVKWPNGAEQWAEYDFIGNIVHFKHTGYPEYNRPPFEQRWEYDSNGKCIYIKNSNGVDRHYD